MRKNGGKRRRNKSIVKYSNSIITPFLCLHFTFGKFDFEYYNVGACIFPIIEHVKNKSQFSCFDDSPPICVEIAIHASVIRRIFC